MVDIRREKHQFTLRDLTRIFVTFWTQDDFDIHP